MGSKEVKVVFGPCVFCGKSIDVGGPDPCRVTVETRKEGWQVWSCHAECFKSRIAEVNGLDLSPAHF